MVDKMNQITEVQGNIRELPIPCVLCFVEHFVHQQILRIVNDISFELGICLETIHDGVISCVLGNFEIFLERKEGFLNSEDANFFRVKILDTVRLAGACFSEY